MIQRKTLELINKRAVRLRNALDNNLSDSDPIELHSWLDEVDSINVNLNYLIEHYDSNTWENQYYSLSNIFLVTNRIINSSNFIGKGTFSSFLNAAKGFHYTIKDLLIELEVFLNRKNIEEQLDANKKIDQLIKKIADLQDDANKISEQTKKHTAYFNDHLKESLNNADKIVKNFSSEVKTLSKEAKIEFRTDITQFEEESINRILVTGQGVDKKLESGLRQLTMLENSLNNALEKELNNFNEATKETQTLSLQVIRNASSDASNSIIKNLSSSISKFDQHCNENISSINKRIDQEVREFESKKIEITDILGEISTAYQAGANTKQADKEQDSADSYRKYGIIGLVVTIFCSIWLFNDYIHFFSKPSGTVTPINDLGFGWFALRFMTITLLTAPSIYMLKESAYHRSKENLYRQRGTHLASIGAYLNELEPAERAAMKKELAANFFSFYDGKADTSNVPDFIKNMKEAITIAKSISPQNLPNDSNIEKNNRS